MKSLILLFLFIVSLIVVPSCKRKEAKQVTFANAKTLAMLSDSIDIIDSIVNVIRNSHNREAHLYANRALGMAFTINSQEALARALFSRVSLTGILPVIQA